MIPLVASSVIPVPTFTTLLNVAAVPVTMKSVLATPVKPDPSPTNDVAVTIPVELMLAKVEDVLVIILSVDATPVKPDPSP